jgi:hypothetical protein
MNIIFPGAFLKYRKKKKCNKIQGLASIRIYIVALKAGTGYQGSAI